jgi:hypothetical protein
MPAMLSELWPPTGLAISLMFNLLTGYLEQQEILKSALWMQMSGKVADRKADTYEATRSFILNCDAGLICYS